MKDLKVTILSLIISGVYGFGVFAQTSISGSISNNTTWNTAGSPYVITGSTTINNGDTLTIETGVEVRFENNFQLTVSGALVGNGVTFTANSGSARGTWNRIFTNFPNSWIHLRNSTLQFAQDPIYVGAGSVRLDTVTISDSNRGITILQGTNTTINGSSISNTEYPINIASEGYIAYEGTNDFTGNDNDVVYLSHQSNIDVNFTLENPGIPYLPSGSKYVSSGDTLTVKPGVIIKFNQNNELYTQDGGVIIAEGTESEPIYFTSNRNDNIGGDTNNDGTATSADNRDWDGVRAVGSGTGSFRHVNVSFAGRLPHSSSSDFRGGITLVDNNSPIDSSTFSNNYYGIVLRDSSDAAITNNTIGSSGVVPVALTFDSEPTFTNNSFSSSNNQFDAIGLIGTTIQGYNYLPKRNFTSLPNVTYLLLRELYVDTGATLEIEPGVVIKSTGSGIRVKGTLLSDGTESEPIVFTSVKDDNVGNPNDTNKDGNNSVPDDRDWRGIALGEDAGASVLDFNEIRYAYYNTSFIYNAANNLSINPRGAVNIMNSDVTISNSEIGNSELFAIDSRGVAKPTISNNSFSNTGSVPVALDLSSDPTFNGNTVANVGLIAIGYHGGTLNNDGIIRARNFAGFDNITTVLLENTTIASGTKLTIEPGTVVKVNWGGSRKTTLWVEGALEAIGAADSVIYFTSIYDDQVGNPLDTNGDGGGTSPGSDNWGTIRFLSTTDDANSEISNTEIRYSKHGLIFTNSAPTINNVTILSCHFVGFGIESGSTVSIQNSTIQNCGTDPIAISSNANPTFSGITFNGNGSNGVSLLESNSLASFNSSFNEDHYFWDTRNTITADATLSPYSIAGFSNLPFILRHPWYIGENTTFSVDPSVVFKGDERLGVDGAFRVLGTSSEPVIFTSYSDDSAGGDSNNDGNNTVPDRGQSSQIIFNPSSIDSLNLIKNTEFRYPGNAITFQSSYAKIDSNLFQLSRESTIHIFGNSDPLISNNRFENIGESFNRDASHSIYMDMFSSPVFSGNEESNVSRLGLAIRGGTWGSDATLPFRSFAGIDSIAYVMYGNTTIPSGSKITIPAGMLFKRNTDRYNFRRSSGGFKVDGALVINGTENKPIVFTSDTDDSFGEPFDIYGDGDLDDNYRGVPWIEYSATSDDTNNVVNHAVFKLATRGLVINSANPTITNTRFEDIEYGIELTGVSAPFVENNTFHDLELTPLLISLVSYPQSVSGNVMSGSTYKAIGVRRETLVQDITLPKRTFAGKVGIPYFYTGTYTVGTGAVLTIEPGVINKFNTNAQLRVQKGLIAEGGSTPDSMIVFTSIRDDFYGGDTNADSNATSPDINNWYGIDYEGTSLPAESRLDYTIVKYTRGGSSYAGVLADNSSPTITNSIISNNARGIQVFGSGNPSVTNSDIVDNTEFGVFNRDKTFTINATNNWWGNNSGPTHSTNPTGTGDEVSDGVDFGSFVGSGASNPVLGDVSLNGKVQSFDAAKILRVAALLETLTTKQQNVADVSGNGTVSAMDASFILQYVVGLIEAFPAELNSKQRYDMNTIEGTEDMILTLGAPISLSETEFTISLNVDNVKALYSSEIGLEFNSDELELIDSDISSFYSEGMISENKDKNGFYTLAIASSEAISESGEVATLTFKLKDQNSSPKVSISKFQANEVDLTSTAVSNEDVALNIPDEFQLYQNYPNPFNPSTTIGFDVPDSKTKVRLEIYNILGQKVKTLVNDVYTAGRYKVTWDGTNDTGGQVSTGVYIYRIQAGDVVQSKKLTFIK